MHIKDNIKRWNIQRLLFIRKHHRNYCNQSNTLLCLSSKWRISDIEKCSHKMKMIYTICMGYLLLDTPIRNSMKGERWKNRRNTIRKWKDWMNRRRINQKMEKKRRSKDSTISLHLKKEEEMIRGKMKKKSKIRLKERRMPNMVNINWIYILKW